MPNHPSIHQEYRAAREVGGFIIREDRALIEIRGADRAAWLNNLVTNVVKTLAPGEGNYAFAVNLKGRVIFDADIFVLPDRLCLDIDTRWKSVALSHLDKYLITEDAQLEDVSANRARIAVMGPKAATLVQQLGFGNLTPKSQLQHESATIAGVDCRCIRNDFAGQPAAEFVAANQAAIDAIRCAAQEGGFVPLSRETVDILRIEAGIPKSLDDIDDDVVPPETGQIERGISYHKGCYLGQEVIERMRSHGVLARKLVGLRLDGTMLPAKSAVIKSADAEVGRTTSACWSEALGAVLALGYMKTAHIRPEVALTVAMPQGPTSAKLVDLPVSR